MENTEASKHSTRILSAINHFIVLGIPPKETSAEEVKKNFKKISLLVHPDKWKHENANSTFKKLRESFELLSDVQKQRQYLQIIGLKNFKRSREKNESSNDEDLNEPRKETKTEEQENMENEWKEEYIKKYTGDSKEDRAFQKAFEKRTSSWQKFKKGRKMEARKTPKRSENPPPKPSFVPRACGIYSFHPDEEDEDLN